MQSDSRSGDAIQHLREEHHFNWGPNTYRYVKASLPQVRLVFPASTVFDTKSPYTVEEIPSELGLRTVPFLLSLPLLCGTNFTLIFFCRFKNCSQNWFSSASVHHPCIEKENGILLHCQMVSPLPNYLYPT